MLRVAEHAELTDTGRQRRANEDAFLARAPLFAVADGMGGAQAGEVASSTAIEVLAAGLGQGESVEQRLSEIVRQANSQIHALSVADDERAGMGTTVTAAYVGENDVTLVHVGDSRCYRWRDGALERLTDDHSLVEQMVRQGQLTEQQALNHPQRSIITRALGPESVVEPDAQTVSARDGDLLLLCSDGLTTMISDEQIAAMLARDEPLKATTRALIAAEADDMAMLRLLAREDIGLAVIPPIVVRDELTSGKLVEVAQLDGISEHFLAVTRERRFPNPLIADLLQPRQPSL